MAFIKEKVDLISVFSTYAIFICYGLSIGFCVLNFDDPNDNVFEALWEDQLEDVRIGFSLLR